jgi:tetratricopeptide (TPR) repeat protein
MNNSASKSVVLLAAFLCVDSAVLAFTEEEIAESDRLLQAGEFQSAEALYRRAFERDPTDAQAALRLVYSLIVQAKIKEATSYMDYMIEHGYQFLGEYVSRWGKYSHDPLSVAEAVLAISDQEQRAAVLFSAAAGWADSDPSAAQSWILTLPVGETRDAALAGLARARANAGQAPNQVVLNAFSSDLARQKRLVSVIMALARHNPADAQELIDTYMTDPKMRELAERMFATAIHLPEP